MYKKLNRNMTGIFKDPIWAGISETNGTLVGINGLLSPVEENSEFKDAEIQFSKMNHIEKKE